MCTFKHVDKEFGKVVQGHLQKWTKPFSFFKISNYGRFREDPGSIYDNYCDNVVPPSCNSQKRLSLPKDFLGMFNCFMKKFLKDFEAQ